MKKQDDKNMYLRLNLNEIALADLQDSTNKNFGSGREERAPKVNVINTFFIPSISDETLLVKSETKGKYFNYTTKIKFNNVKYVEFDDENAVKILGVDNNFYYINKLSSKNNEIKVNCTCLDFFYRFAAWNASKDALDGDPPEPYIKKTDREPVNPTKSPGACKHILKLVNNLKNDGILE